jgi:uncharacterized membrane protein
MTVTVAGLYDSYDTAVRVVGDLEAAGFRTEDISIVASDHEGAEPTVAFDDLTSNAGTGGSIGAVVGGGAGLLAGLGIIAIPGLGPVVAAGWLAATALGVVAGGAAGGIIGALTSSGVEEDYAQVYAEGVRRGKSLVTARVSDVQADVARAIINGYGAANPEALVDEYRSSGWNRFDENGPPYSRADAARNIAAQSRPPL